MEEVDQPLVGLADGPLPPRRAEHDHARDPEPWHDAARDEEVVNPDRPAELVHVSRPVPRAVRDEMPSGPRKGSIRSLKSKDARDRRIVVQPRFEITDTDLSLRIARPA